MGQLMLEGKVDDRDLVISGLRSRVSELEQELRQERGQSAAVGVGVKALRGALGPLYGALQRVFGEMEAIGAEPSSPAVKNSAVWDSWKAKLSSAEGRAIDALLLHGEMTVPQLRIHIGCASRTAQNVASSLSGKGLAIRMGGKIRLKEL